MPQRQRQPPSVALFTAVESKSSSGCVCYLARYANRICLWRRCSSTGNAAGGHGNSLESIWRPDDGHLPLKDVGVIHKASGEALNGCLLQIWNRQKEREREKVRERGGKRSKADWCLSRASKKVTQCSLQQNRNEPAAMAGSWRLLYDDVASMPQGDWFPLRCVCGN